MNSSERKTQKAPGKMKQELDNLDRLFVEHYKSMKATKDVVVAPYEGSDTGVLRMEYDMVTEQIHILLKFDKANKMYNFRSERQYPSMDQEAAYHFAMDIAEKYDGFRCNAYDNTVIIQHVGTFRDMEETQAAALLKKSMESFERIAMEKLTEFGDLCGITEPEDAGEIIELPPDHTGETEYDTYELPKPPADRESKNPYATKMAELLFTYETEHQDIKHINPEAEVEKSKEQKESVSTGQTVMKSYLLSHIQKKGGKKYHSDDGSCISARYCEDGIRYFISYVEQEQILEIRVSQKYDKDITEITKENPFHSTVNLKHGNVLILQRTIASCSPDMFEKSLLSMREELDRFTQILESQLPESEAFATDRAGLTESGKNEQLEGSLQKDQEDKYQQWENILKEKEIFLDNQKNEVLSSLEELHQKSTLLYEKEAGLQEEQEKINALSCTQNQKETQLQEKEILLKQKEEVLNHKDDVLVKKSQELLQKEKNLNAQEEDLQKRQELSQMQQRQLKADEAEFYKQRKSGEETLQRMQIQVSSLTNQIRLLKQQKNDIDEILLAKNQELHGTVPTDPHTKEKYESQIREYYTALKQAKIEIDRLEQENLTLRREENTSRNGSNDQRVQELLEELSDAKEEIERLKTASTYQPSDQNQMMSETDAEQFLEFLQIQKGAQPEMLEKRHADDGVLIEIRGAVPIIVSFKSGINFVECTLTKRCNPMVMKKINKYNEQKRKSVIFTTPGEIICRTMFLTATADEIYGMMEEIVNALEEL